MTSYDSARFTISGYYHPGRRNNSIQLFCAVVVTRLPISGLIEITFPTYGFFVPLSQHCRWRFLPNLKNQPIRPRNEPGTSGFSSRALCRCATLTWQSPESNWASELARKTIFVFFVYERALTTWKAQSRTPVRISSRQRISVVKWVRIYEMSQNLINIL